MSPLRSTLAGLLLCASGVMAAPRDDAGDWWSLQPLPAASAVAGHPVDHFLTEEWRRQNLVPAPPADRRTLIRRLSFDLTGLPPAPEEVAAFVADPDPAAYEKLVDRLLASPQYGERWARHWLDVVHYGDTHGYDKDQPRLNAWPYRDYVIRSFNTDKPYARFVEEQLAGDVLAPDSADGIEALGFIAAGPWDFIGHAEVSEDKTDGKIARHLDRDDMVANTMNTFCSITVHCAQCHDHKFDPVSAEDYYSLQAVFAALDRADRVYDTDPGLAARRRSLQGRQKELQQRLEALLPPAREKAGAALAGVDKAIEAARQPGRAPLADHFGWHSEISASQDAARWVQIDLGTSVPVSRIVLHACHDDFAGIGAGFGFPVRFRVEVSDEPAFTTAAAVHLLRDEGRADFPNPGLTPVTASAAEPSGHKARYVRITATKLAPRQNDYIFALGELQVLDAAGQNLAAGAAVTSADSIEAAPRWQRRNLTDGWYYGQPAAVPGASNALAKLTLARRLILEASLGEAPAADLLKTEDSLAVVQDDLAALPPGQRVYCGTVHTGSGTFTGTGAIGGAPRLIHVLSRGDVNKPGPVAPPGSLTAVKSMPARFPLEATAPEGQRRLALAHWITDPRNPLTWRSIVNRVWQYHFGRALADSPNDLGRMGLRPTHPALLDWLAASFRDDMGGSFKKLHRLLVTSAAYRQASVAPVAGSAAAASWEAAEKTDPENLTLWRMPRRKLEAEAVRDAMLQSAGMLDLTMGGPAFQDFVIKHPEHSPHYEYHLADLSDARYHRRSIYRFLVRSKPQPWMAALDCADASMLVDKRNQTITPLQALAQLNNQLCLVAASRFAARVEKEAGGALPQQITFAFQQALQRDPSPQELAETAAYAQTHGLPAVCRVLLNLNEFMFVD